MVDGAIKASERPYYYWLLSSLQKLKIDPGTVGLSEVRPLSTLWVLTKTTSRLDAARHADKLALFAEMDAKIDKHANLHKPQESGMSMEQYSEALDAWASKYSDKRRRYEDLRDRLRMGGFSGEQLKILVYELAFFLNLISFETAFEALRKHREEGNIRSIGKHLGRLLVGWRKAARPILRAVRNSYWRPSGIRPKI